MFTKPLHCAKKKIKQLLCNWENQKECVWIYYPSENKLTEKRLKPWQMIGRPSYCIKTT